MYTSIMPHALDLSCTQVCQFFLHNSNYYNTAKHSYKNDAIGSMIGMGTLNDLSTNNTINTYPTDTDNKTDTNTDTKEYTKIHLIRP